MTNTQGRAVQCSVFIATSLDGFIARPDGAIDWLTPMGDPTSPTGEDYAYRAFMQTVDVLVMGRGTFEKVMAFEPWPYGDKPVVVLSSKPLVFSPRIPRSVERMTGSPAEIVVALAQRGAAHLYIDGGKTIQAFLRAGLIQRLIVSQIPVAIGRGIPLWADLGRDVRLEHRGTRTFPTGLVQSEYSVLA